VNLLPLMRYNFRVLMLNNWWLLVFPVAVSILSVFWNVVTQRFNMVMPARTVEMVSPLLAAFLGAHLLSAEYRSRIGAVLASRPVNISKIVVLRLVVMLALVWGLAWISLQAYATWMESFNTEHVYQALIPSTLFITMLALTFATLFRNSMVGFGLAALYWLLDLPPGAPLNPYLSLQSLTAHYAELNMGVQMDPSMPTLVGQWWVAKWILIAGALLLYLYHSRLVFGLGTTGTLRVRRRALLAYGLLLVFYVGSGAALKVKYGYENRGRLFPNDAAWFRYQFASFGPIPVAPLFGPAFPRFLGEFTNPWRATEEEADQLGDTVKHRRDLKYILDKMPDSRWAPSAADAYARLEARKRPNLEEQIALFRLIVDKYSASPYVDSALRTIALRYNEAGKTAEARAAYEELLKKVPNSKYRADATDFIERTAAR
jgi:hypothetical protein